MYGLSILFFIFATLVLLVGFYMFKGNKISIMTGRVSFQNLNKNEWKNIGKWTMLSSILLYIIAIIGYIFKL